MANPNEYLVFEADQVLTNDHLNQLFYYVDQQNRWTRNKLIGIGIACGLNIVQQPGVIQVTKGCGVTSQGYLILLDTSNYSYYLPYSAIDQPDDLPFTYPGNLPFYKPYCSDKKVFLLLTDDDHNNLESNKKSQAQTLSSANFLNDYAVALFLEATETDLKNCDAFDCNNKGEKMQFEVRALLVKKTDLPAAVQDKPRTNKADVTKLTAPEIDFKRFNVPYKKLQSTDDILNAFTDVVDDNTLSTVAKAYSYCYERYNSYFFGIPANPFTNLFNDLKKLRANVLKTNPVFIQYFYDFIDDLIKAYYEFRAKAYGLISKCCPDENLFPLHLVLGSATANTTSFDKDSFRQYFIYSPLFERQDNEMSEVVFLFMRMQLIIKDFTILTQKITDEIVSKITPSQYEYHQLSGRAIPYYYKVNEKGNELYKYWSYYKTVHGNAAFNLGYNSNLYNGSSGVVQPLLYDIEHYNFFRIEGHIGLDYRRILANLLQQRQNYNLPFDVVAISAEQLSLDADDLPECNMEDIETGYKLIVSEFACKVHVPFCFFSQSPFTDPRTNAAGVTGNSIKNDSMPSFAEIKTEAVQQFNEPVLFSQPGYVKGDFLRKYCPPKPGTVASAYIEALSDDGTFTNPLSPDQKNPLVSAYFYTFEFIDSVEELMKVLLNSDIATLNIGVLKSTYLHYLGRITILTNLLAFFNDLAASSAETKSAQWLLEYDLDLLLVEFGVLTSICLDERLLTLKDEYNRRLKLYQQQRSFLYYYKNHPGLEHKAGVPKGGTFVLVYHAVQPAATAVTAVVGVRTDRQLNTSTVTVADTSKTAVASGTEINQQYADDKIISLFANFVNECNDAPAEKKKEILDTLGKLRRPTTPKYQIADNAIVADFYIPYLCCSDCPPVAYVLSEKQPDAVQFDITPKEFLFDDAHNYPFVTKPPVTQANVEQNPFNPTDNLKYPAPLNLLADEKNVLYLHPAIPELTQTLKATITYKDIPVDITIIKPDATFTVNVIKDDTHGTVQVAAVSKDADNYEWLVNGENGIFKSSPDKTLADPLPADLLSAFPNAQEFVIELTVTYVRNDNTSDDTKSTTLTRDKIIVDSGGKP